MTLIQVTVFQEKTKAKNSPYISKNIEIGPELISISR